MNPKTPGNLRKDGMIAVIAVFVLLIGTATDNAYSMLALSVASIAVIAICFRKQLNRSVLLTMTLAATTAFAIAVAVTVL